MLVLGLAWTFCLHGQKKGFGVFTESCFRNPALPYCPGRDLAPKPEPKGGAKSGAYGMAGATVGSTIDAAGIDWRFADPDADAVAVLNSSKLSAAPLAHSLIDQLGSKQGLTQDEAQNVFGTLSGVSQVALSVRGDKILLMITGRPPDSILPAPKPGWKAVPLGTNTVLMGNADAVDQASQRLAMNSGLGELPSAAQQRTIDSEFWTAGSAKLAGQEAVSAGVKRFELTASMRDSLASETVFEFDEAPDPGAFKSWFDSLHDAKLEGSDVRVSTLMEADVTRRNAGVIAASPLGQRLAAIISSARYLPVHDTGAAVHTHPVIYGLDGGPREVK